MMRKARKGLRSWTMPTGYDHQGRRTWWHTQRIIIHYDDDGRPKPTVELPVRTIGRSVQRL